jgi:hypothetical protein
MTEYTDIKQALEAELRECYFKPGDQGIDSIATMLEDMERFLDALPTNKKVRPAVVEIIKRAIHSSAAFGHGFPPILAVLLLTYINSESSQGE